jgi:transcriptional regulator with XRE-family HTH domain
MEHGVLFRMLRETHKMSRETLASELNNCVSSIARLENGERQATHDEIEKASILFHVDPSFFFSKTGSFGITHGDNSHGVINGNVVTMDRDLLLLIMETMKKNSEVMNTFVQFMKRN